MSFSFSEFLFLRISFSFHFTFNIFLCCVYFILYLLFPFASKQRSVSFESMSCIFECLIIQCLFLQCLLICQCTNFRIFYTFLSFLLFLQHSPSPTHQDTQQPPTSRHIHPRIVSSARYMHILLHDFFLRSLE